jgi:hypothetical protein
MPRVPLIDPNAPGERSRSLLRSSDRKAAARRIKRRWIRSLFGRAESQTFAEVGQSPTGAGMGAFS